MCVILFNLKVAQNIYDQHMLYQLWIPVASIVKYSFTMLVKKNVDPYQLASDEAS